MDWVKRNLVFVVGGVVSLVLLLLSGFFLYSNSQKNSKAREQLEAEYSELQRLSTLKPHPGKGDVNNIRAAKEQKAELLQVMDRVRGAFKPISAIPEAEKVTGAQFSAELRRTLDQLTRQAEESSVLLPTNYSFSFEAEKRLVKFAPGSLDRLAVQLGEVKVISMILFDAKVNKLTGLRRERVSADDYKGPQSDYLGLAPITNDLASIAPYQITFESFSAELADVIAGFANSPYGVVIKDINVRPASAVMSTSRFTSMGEERYAPATPIYTPTPTVPTERYQATRYPEMDAYGGGGGAGAIRQPTFRRPFEGTGGGGEGRYAATPTPTPRPTYPTYAAQVAGGYPGAASAVSQTLIDESPLSVTLLVEVFKLNSPSPE